MTHDQSPNSPRYHTVDLDDGIRLAVATLPWTESAAFGIWVPTGSRHDPAPLSGLAHFVEHMTFKGTARRDARAISVEIEGQGGALNASTSEEHTCYEAYAEAELLPLLADIASDIVWHPAFPAGEFALEREVIREEILHYRDSPSDHITDLLAQALWAPHRLGHPISGTPESIDLIEPRHLREHAAAHHHRRDMVIGVAGPVGPDEAASIVAPLLPASPATAPHPEDPFIPDESAAPARLRETRETGQLHLAIGFLAPGRHHPDRFALRLLSLILGENSSSRLFQELRERRGLCYHVSSDVSLFAETGALEITLALEPEHRQLALDCIRRELDDLMENGPTADELQRAKRYTIGQSKIGFETTASHLFWTAESLLYHNRIIEPEEIRENIRRVTLEDAGRVAAATFHPNRAVIAEIAPA